jgi:hypothetical protein
MEVREEKSDKSRAQIRSSSAANLEETKMLSLFQMHRVFSAKINKTDVCVTGVLYLEYLENLSSQWPYNYCQSLRQPDVLRGGS